MQGSIFTAPQMPVPSVAPHSVMQGTMSRSGSLGRSGYDILNGDLPPMGTSLLNQALGAVSKDADQANKCAKEHKPLREKLAASMNVIIRTLGYKDPSQENYRCYFRLGEILARADKNILALGWGYAGPSTNEPSKKGQEGTDFRASDGSNKKAKGHQGRIEDEKNKSSGTGRMCQMSNLLKSTISVCDILATQFTGKQPQECRQIFSSMMRYYLAPDPKAAAWVKGMEFLPTAGAYTPLEALTGIKKAGLKKETGLFETAKKEVKKGVEKEVKNQIMSKFAGDPGKAEAAAAAYSNMPAEALAQPVVGGSAESAAYPADAAYEMPPSPGKNIGLAALAAAAVGAFLIFKS